MIDCKFFAVHEANLAHWEQVYHPLNVRGELDKMVLWLDANPRRRKRRYERFVVNWLNKEHAKIQRAQIESRAYASVGSNHRDPTPEQHAANLKLLAELEEWKAKQAVTARRQ